MSTPATVDPRSDWSDHDWRMNAAGAAFLGAPLEFPNVILTGGSSSDELVPYVAAALLAVGIETDWSQGQNTSVMSGSMMAGLAAYRARADVHEPANLTTAGTPAEADHYIGPTTWARLMADAADALDEWHQATDVDTFTPEASQPAPEVPPVGEPDPTMPTPPADEPPSTVPTTPDTTQAPTSPTSPDTTQAPPPAPAPGTTA